MVFKTVQEQAGRQAGVSTRQAGTISCPSVTMRRVIVNRARTQGAPAILESSRARDSATQGRRAITRRVDDWQHGVACISWRIAMKTIVSALIALSVLAGVAAPANALDAKAFYEQQDRQSH